jgi:hypothetical protein
LFELPDRVRIWMGHDYLSGGRVDVVPCVSVGDHKVSNIHVGRGVSEEDFVAMRTERDRGLGAPRLLSQALQVNIRGGMLPGGGGEWGSVVGLKVEGDTWAIGRGAVSE